VSRKLLLADDSVTIQRVVELTFSGEDIEVVTVSDGEQAIARMSTDPPDIVLADIAMPKKNGYEVAAFVRSIRRWRRSRSCCWPGRSNRWTRSAPDG
jgi:CheY-like chemotaxis protein